MSVAGHGDKGVDRCGGGECGNGELRIGNGGGVLCGGGGVGLLCVKGEMP